MFDNFSGRVTDSLVHNQIINIEDRDIYCYGVQQGLVAVLNFATTLLIGCLCGMLWESILYMISYIPIRHFVGGFHAKTPVRCYLFSIFMLFSVLLAMKWIDLSSSICGLILMLSLIFIGIFAPVADQKKPLDQKEHRVYHIRAIIITGIEVSIALVCLVLKMGTYASCISWCLVLVIIMMGLGMAKVGFSFK